MPTIAGRQKRLKELHIVIKVSFWFLLPSVTPVSVSVSVSRCHHHWE